MSGKGRGNGGKGGFLDSVFDNPFGGMFDFNGDGKEDLGEQWLAYKIFDDIAKKDKEQSSDYLGGGLNDLDDIPDYSWRLRCEDGVEFGIDFKDYETEEEYEEALEYAKLEAEEVFTDNCGNDSSSPTTSSVTFQNAETQNPEAAVTTEEDETASYSTRDAAITGTVNQNAASGISKVEYNATLWKTILSVTRSMLVTLSISAFPCIIMWTAIAIYDETNIVSILITFVFFVGGIALLFLILSVFLSYISCLLKRKKVVKEKDMASISEEVNQKHALKIKKWETISVVCVLLVFVSVMAAFAAEQYHIHSVYSEAEKLISEERFLEAEEALKRIADSDYKDTGALLLLCDAHKDYAAGNLVGAYYAMTEAHFEHQSSEELSSIQSFKQILRKEYDQYSKERYARRAQEYEERLKNGVPYVGMYESRIGDTSLGKPSDKVRHNDQVKNGEQLLANLYDFYDGKNLIFTARCINGVVTEVWDYRDDPVKPYVPGKDHTLSTGPSVDGFLNPEDFYDWYRDDFVDYYDAEEYYYAHGGA